MIDIDYNLMIVYLLLHFEDHFFVFKEFSSENSVLKPSKMISEQELVIMVQVGYMSQLVFKPHFET